MSLHFCTLSGSTENDPYNTTKGQLEYFKNLRDGIIQRLISLNYFIYFGQFCRKGDLEFPQLFLGQCQKKQI